jgi:predicted nucleic acid-binding protein
MVVDASAVVLALLNNGDARRSLATASVALPHLADSEVAHALRSQVRRGAIDEATGRIALDRWSRLGSRRFPVVGLLTRVWALCDNLSAYDAAYVALAEAIGCELLTADSRLARATGPTCPMIVVRR